MTCKHVVDCVPEEGEVQLGTSGHFGVVHHRHADADLALVRIDRPFDDVVPLSLMAGIPPGHAAHSDFLNATWLTAGYPADQHGRSILSECITPSGPVLRDGHQIWQYHSERSVQEGRSGSPVFLALPSGDYACVGIMCWGGHAAARSRLVAADVLVEFLARHDCEPIRVLTPEHAFSEASRRGPGLASIRSYPLTSLAIHACLFSVLTFSMLGLVARQLPFGLEAEVQTRTVALCIAKLDTGHRPAGLAVPLGGITVKDNLTGITSSTPSDLSGHVILRDRRLPAVGRDLQVALSDPSLVIVAPSVGGLLPVPSADAPPVTVLVVSRLSLAKVADRCEFAPLYQRVLDDCAPSAMDGPSIVEMVRKYERQTAATMGIDDSTFDELKGNWIVRASSSSNPSTRKLALVAARKLSQLVEERSAEAIRMAKEHKLLAAQFLTDAAGAAYGQRDFETASRLYGDTTRIYEELKVGDGRLFLSRLNNSAADVYRSQQLCDRVLLTKALESLDDWIGSGKLTNSFLATALNLRATGLGFRVEMDQRSLPRSGQNAEPVASRLLKDLEVAESSLARARELFARRGLEDRVFECDVNSSITLRLRSEVVRNRSDKLAISDDSITCLEGALEKYTVQSVLAEMKRAAAKYNLAVAIVSRYEIRRSEKANPVAGEMDAIENARNELKKAKELLSEAQKVMRDLSSSSWSGLIANCLGSVHVLEARDVWNKSEVESQFDMAKKGLDEGAKECPYEAAPAVYLAIRRHAVWLRLVVGRRQQGAGRTATLEDGIRLCRSTLEKCRSNRAVTPQAIANLSLGYSCCLAMERPAWNDVVWLLKEVALLKDVPECWAQLAIAYAAAERFEEYDETIRRLTAMSQARGARGVIVDPSNLAEYVFANMIRQLADNQLKDFDEGSGSLVAAVQKRQIPAAGDMMDLLRRTVRESQNKGIAAKRDQLLSLADAIEHPANAASSEKRP